MRALAALVLIAIVVGVAFWINAATTTANNITCVKQATVALPATVEIGRAS